MDKDSFMSQTDKPAAPVPSLEEIQRVISQISDGFPTGLMTCMPRNP